MHWLSYHSILILTIWTSVLVGQSKGLQKYGIKDGLHCEVIEKIKIDAENYVHIYCVDNRRYIFDGEKCKEYKHSDLNGTFQKPIIHAIVKSFQIKNAMVKVTSSTVANNHVWIGSERHGIYLLSHEGDIVDRINIEDGINSNHIIGILKDKWSNIYFATKKGGFYSYRDNHFSAVLPDITSPITVLETDSNNRAWHGTSNNGIYIYGNNKMNHLNAESSFISTPINVIAPDSKNRVWIGTAKEGLFLYDHLDRMILFNDPGLCPSKKITGVYQDQGDRLWIATEDSGIILLQEDDSIFYYLRSFDDQIKPGLNHILDMQWTPSKLWFVSNDLGLGWIDLNDFTTNLYDHSKSGLSKQIDKIRISDGKLYALTSENLAIINLSNDEIQVVKSTDPIKSIIDFTLDKRKNLWVMDHSSIHKIDFHSNNYSIKTIPIPQSRKNPLQSLSIDQNDVCTIGLQSGLIRGHDLSSISYIAPELKITDVRLFYESLSDSIQSLMIDHEMNRPSFSHDQNHLDFSYSGHLPGVQDDILYSYRFLGLDDSWSPPSAMTSVNFANLPAGKLTFEVKAIHPYDYLLSSDIKRVSFIIKSPLWHKLWFQLLVGSALFILGFIAIKNRLDRIQKRNNDQKNKLKLKNKLLDLERSALQLQMNPHFIFNALNTVKKQLRVKDVKTSEQILTKFSTLMRNTLEHSRQSKISLEDEIEMLDSYLSIEQISRNHSFQYSIDHNLEDSFDVYIPPMMLQPFVENAVQHGIAGRRTGLIRLTFEQKGKMIICYIIDDGPGLKSSKSSTHKSRAIQVTSDRLALLTDTRKDHLYIDNIIGDSGQILGVEVEIWLPML